MQSPLADLLDNADILGDRYEFARRDIAAFGMIPSHQRFERLHLVRLRIDDRLVEHAQLIFFERVAQVLFHLAAHLRAILQVARIEAVLPAPTALRGVQRQVRRLDQFSCVQPIIRRDGDPERAADDSARSVD